MKIIVLSSFLTFNYFWLLIIMGEDDVKLPGEGYLEAFGKFIIQPPNDYVKCQLIMFYLNIQVCN